MGASPGFEVTTGRGTGCQVLLRGYDASPPSRLVPMEPLVGVEEKHPGRMKRHSDAQEIADDDDFASTSHSQLASVARTESLRELVAARTSGVYEYCRLLQAASGVTFRARCPPVSRWPDNDEQFGTQLPGLQLSQGRTTSEAARTNEGNQLNLALGSPAWISRRSPTGFSKIPLRTRT
jgi:hypothetical protein